jgi:hypothetical protein
MWLHRAAAIAVLSALALGSASARSDDGQTSQGQQPPAGLLEFLGSVDRLSEVNPNYLSQPNPQKVVARPPAASAPKPPPPPPPAPPVPNTAGPGPSGEKNNG